MKQRSITCLVIIGLGGLLFAFGDLLIPQENTIFEAAERPAEFAQLVTSNEYALWATRGFIGVIMEMIGTVGLCLYLQNSRAEKLAFYGLLITLVHQILGAGVFAVAYFLFPAIGKMYLAGNTNAVAFAAFEGPLAAYFGISLVSTLVGLAVMATAVYKSGTLPKWSGWLAFLGFLLIPVPGVIVQFVANTTWALAYFWMAWYIYKNSTDAIQTAKNKRALSTAA